MQKPAAFALFGKYIQVYLRKDDIFAIIGQTMAIMMLVWQRSIYYSDNIGHCNSVVPTLTDNFRSWGDGDRRGVVIYYIDKVR